VLKKVFDDNANMLTRWLQMLSKVLLLKLLLHFAGKLPHNATQKDALPSKYNE